LKKFTTYDGRTDGRRTPSDGKSSLGLWPGELKNQKNKTVNIEIKTSNFGGQYYSRTLTNSKLSVNTYIE